MKSEPEPLVIAWLDTQRSAEIWTTSISVFEIHFGISVLPDGRRKRALAESFGATLKRDLKGHILDFDTVAARQTGELSAIAHNLGRPVEIRDSQIAGIVSAHQATLATRNTKHFADAGIVLVNPWDFEQV